MFKLRDYQEVFLSDILNSLKLHNRVCCQLSTGGGKTVVFTELATRLNDKTLILVDSIDLVNQTKKTFERQGINVGLILAGCKKIPDNKIIIGMIKSVWNRKEKIPEFKYVIYDECHVWEGNKLFTYLTNSKIIGFTATPVRLKRYDYEENITAVEVMADVYDVLICGKPIEWLIENKYLVKDENYLIDFDYSGLKTDSSGEFTVESMKKVFQSEDYQKALKHTYEVYCLDKKTMIFTASTETNQIFAELFKDRNVKTYDSVNNKSNERDEIIEWFRNTPDAILINTGCFTKGFDVCDVEAIIVARATKSLALWIQIVGRGSRITNKTQKDKVIVIDGGNNIAEHGTFSFNRDWKKIFSDRKMKVKIEPQQECESCGFIFPEKEKKCPDCGELVPEKEISEEIEKELKLFEIEGQKAKLEPPKIDINFFINKGVSDYQALKILKNKWVTFLVKSKIEEKDFKYHWLNGTFIKRFSVLLKPQYLEIIRSILPKGKNVIYSNYCKKILTEAYTKKYES